MDNIMYQRIRELCSERGITITKLESDLGFGNASIKKWGKTSSPSFDKVAKVAMYFDVSSDYLSGLTDIKSPISEVIKDKDIISFQRARQKMTPKDKERMMQMLKIGFDYAFSDQEGSND